MTGTISGGIANSDAFKKDADIFMYGMLSALTAATVWLFFATYMEWPVSTTHSISAFACHERVRAHPALCPAPAHSVSSPRGRTWPGLLALCDATPLSGMVLAPLCILTPACFLGPPFPAPTVGGVIGFALAFKGEEAIIWNEETLEFPFRKGITVIVISWFTSPVFAAIGAAIIFFLCRTLVLRRENSFQKSFYVLPAAILLTIFINVFFVLSKARGELHDAPPSAG